MYMYSGDGSRKLHVCESGGT